MLLGKNWWVGHSLRVHGTRPSGVAKEMSREVKKVQLPRTCDFEICIFLKFLISEGEDKVYGENIKTGKRKLRKTLDDA